MSGFLPPTDLVGVDEIGEMMGLDPSEVRTDKIAHRKGFPAPVAVLALGRVWQRADILRWLEDGSPDTHPGPYVGVREIQAVIGLSEQRVYQLIQDPGFPEPIVTLKAGRVWLRSTIAEWNATRPRRKPGRPRKVTA